jgi:hypothetical protein
MKLGELIRDLEDYRACTIGVDDDTEVKIHVPGHTVDTRATLEDVRVELTMSRVYNRQTQAVVILEGVEA